MVERNIPLSGMWLQLAEPIKDSASARKEAEEKAEVKGLLWTDEIAHLVADEIYYDDGTICVSGTFGAGHYLSLDVPVTKQIASDIIEAYMKKLGRLKTLLEVASKMDEDA